MMARPDEAQSGRARGGPDRTVHDVLIIGAGPAGYTAGIYCARAGRSTMILSGALPGGQLVNTTDVENYPGFERGIMGPDLMAAMRSQTDRMGAQIVDGEAVNVDFARRPFRVLTASEEYEARSVIIATGASPLKLGVPGELELGGRGVSYCATCDGPFFRDQELVVVGGGDTAMEESTFLTKFASRVHLVHRRAEFRASRIMQDRARADPKIEMHMDTTVESITGDPKVQSVRLLNRATGESSSLDVGGVFVAIGHSPNTKAFEGQVELDEKGYIRVSEGPRTSVEGVFAAGDVHDHEYRQAVTAAGFGCMAALAADRYLASEG